ncbi:MAG: SDR family oxidoreductase [Planctomycetota bacterium]|nr:SDR family oxidoreductase [Planctomycetota bacterium]MDA1179893.1 SDR family oxidoreductase [Planctomycetota bacterium]
MSFLQLEGRTVLVTGVANRKSVAWHVAQFLHENGAHVVYAVRTEARRASVSKLLQQSQIEAPVYVCDVADEQQIEQLAESLRQLGAPLHGMLHSIAFASYEEGLKPFHETKRAQMLQAFDISCFSLTALSHALKDLFAPDASVVAISISTTRMASESYGYMAPIKAALDSSLAFLAKSFSRFSQVRFNAVSAGLLKTSASAGIPGYVDAYLYAENVIPRRKALQTDEVASVAAFLLSPRSSGINAQSVVVDAGMEINYFDQDIVKNYFRGS